MLEVIKQQENATAWWNIYLAILIYVILPIIVWGSILLQVA